MYFMMQNKTKIKPDRQRPEHAKTCNYITKTSVYNYKYMNKLCLQKKGNGSSISNINKLAYFEVY
jgi:hypothetical protein